MAAVVLHVDMDAFFAAVEQRDHPEWRGRPVIVGADPHARGVVSTCSYEARRYGVHSAMPSRTAYQKCPNGVFVRPRLDVYAAVSEQVFEVFGRFSPIVEKVSVDEAFLDVTGTVHLFGGVRALGERLRAEVKRVSSLTCSVGLAANRLLAKIGSEEAKPDGLYVMPFEPEAVRAWLAPRPVRILWGVGSKTNEILLKYGYRTCGDLQTADSRFLERILGPAAAASIQAHANGEDFTAVTDGDEEKSVSREHTFSRDETDRERVRACLLELAAEVGRRVRKETRWARTAKLKLRDGTFSTRTHQAAFALPARDDLTFRHRALALFDHVWPPGKRLTVRLIGFGVEDFLTQRPEEEPTLFPTGRSEKQEKRERLSEVLDRLNLTPGLPGFADSNQSDP